MEVSKFAAPPAHFRRFFNGPDCYGSNELNYIYFPLIPADVTKRCRRSAWCPVDRRTREVKLREPTQTSKSTMDALPANIPSHESLLTPDIVLHVAEVLARRNHPATSPELAMTCREHFYAALPALYREISFERDDGPRISESMAEGDALGANRHSFIRVLRNVPFTHRRARHFIKKASGLMSLNVTFFNGEFFRIRRLSKALADKPHLANVSLQYAEPGHAGRRLQYDNKTAGFARRPMWNMAARRRTCFRAATALSLRHNCAPRRCSARGAGLRHFSRFIPRDVPVAAQA